MPLELEQRPTSEEIAKAEAELHGWVNHPFFGPRRKKAVEHLIRQLRFPTFWVDRYTLMARVYLPGGGFVVRRCMVSTKGIRARLQGQHWSLQIQNNHLVFPEGVCK